PADCRHSPSRDFRDAAEDCRPCRKSENEFRNSSGRARPAPQRLDRFQAPRACFQSKLRRPARIAPPLQPQFESALPAFAWRGLLSTVARTALRPPARSSIGRGHGQDWLRPREIALRLFSLQPPPDAVLRETDENQSRKEDRLCSHSPLLRIS